MRKPDFFIVGAPRCGTTAMFLYLKQHPELFLPEVKEYLFFGTDLNPRYHDPTSYTRNREKYLSLFAGVRGEKRVGDGTVLYIYSKRAAIEIKEFNPSAKIVIMMRNPADMLHSMHNQLVITCNEDIIDFKAALEAEDDRRGGRRIPKHLFLTELVLYKEWVKYAEHLEKYRAVFGKDNVHVIIFDDFVNNALNVFKETLRFLDVNEEFIPQMFAINSSRRIRSEKLQNRINKYARYVSTPLFARLRRLAEIYNTEADAKAQMDPGLRLQLQAEFLPEVERLSNLLGRDLTHWCR
jgi:sulfotransferase family protein